MTQTGTFQAEREAVEAIRSGRDRIHAELDKVIVGQKEVIDQLLVSLFAGGNCLLTGAPGLAKTLLVRSLAEIFDLHFNRIQFTPDLMPADITGTEILEDDLEGRRLKFVQGPIFANVILADEINRTPPKTQAALLEAMQEHQVTAAGKRYVLPQPFFVLATQNPIEMEGTYPLPEAQLDRFMFNVHIDYLPIEDEIAVVQRTTSDASQKIDRLFSAEDVLRFHQTVRKVPVANELVRYAVELVDASRPNRGSTPKLINEWVNWGAGIRGAQNLVLGAKAHALFQGRTHVSANDINALLVPTLRHRILPSYRAQAENISVEMIIERIVESVKPPVI